MQNIRTFLRQAKSSCLNSATPIRMVLGNTSGDMDSVVGSIGLAYFYSLQENKQWTPVINCNSDEFKLRSEIYKHVVVDCGIQPEELLFLDEFLTLNRAIEEVALIDHNMMDPYQACDFGADIGSKVTRIIDHHFDNEFYPKEQLKQNIVKFIGSACSIAAQLFKENEHIFSQEDFAAGRNFAYLFAAAIVLDTYNFKPELMGSKWQEEDLEAMNWLRTKTDQIGSNYFDALSHAKFDQDVGLRNGVRGVLVRDYKNYKLSNGKVSGRMGIAVSVAPVAKILDTFGEKTTCQEIEAFIEERELSLFGMSCSVMDTTTGESSRHLMIYSRFTDGLANEYDSLISNIRQCNNLQVRDEVQGTFGEARYTHWNLGNLSISRKKFETFLKQYYAH